MALNFKWLTGFFGKIASLFTSDAAKRDLDAVANFTAAALPYIDIAGQIVTGLTPTTIYDIAFAAIKRKFPRLFDGTITSGDELKLYALGIAADLLASKFPQLSTSAARAAVQLAFISQK